MLCGLLTTATNIIDPQCNGWKQTEKVECDSEDNIKQIKHCVDFLLHGCKCKSSKCQIKLCKCVKNGQFCGPGCECKGCLNQSSQGKLLRLYTGLLTLMLMLQSIARTGFLSGGGICPLLKMVCPPLEISGLHTW